MTELYTFGDTDYIPRGFKRNIEVYSGDAKDGSIMAWLNTFIGHCRSERLNEEMAVNALRQCLKGDALDIMHAAYRIGQEKGALVKVIRNLESSFGQLMDAQKARALVNTIRRKPGESLDLFNVRTRNLAEMATRFLLPTKRRHDETELLIESALLNNVSKVHKNRLQERIHNRRLQGADPLNTQELVAALREMERSEDDGGYGWVNEIHVVNAVVPSTGDASSILKGEDSVMSLEARNRFRSRHPSAPRSVAINGQPHVRERSLSAQRGRSSSRDRFKVMDGRHVFDRESQRLLRLRTPSRDRARGRSRERSSSNSRDAAGVQRRQSRSPSANSTGRFDAKELNVGKGDCLKCGLYGHDQRSTSCSLFLKKLTTRCPACGKGGHLAVDCPIRPVSGNV